ncbi:hypothetical protein [Enterobacter roggenkampii]|uniref:hypothetical protein n=1 Tax=Enterobacter roggenkampii TaxID=1812935 RepID=UPI000735AD84|nr:hypothetical protein [Enterobacter roggenkampii]KTI34239.1 hypothetical protein ASV07_14735 [Enterobacter roggenkampii]
MMPWHSPETDAILESMPRKQKRQKLIYNVAENDAEFCIGCIMDGKIIRHGAYAAWINMLQRCYGESYRSARKQYLQVSLDPTWHKFSAFYAWWKPRYRTGWHLDKDLLIPGNQIYGPSTCVYIPKELNNFTVGRDCKRGDLPIGVSWDKQHSKYMSRANDSKGKYLFLGLYDDPMEAHEAWFFKKLEIALEYKGLCDSIHPDLYRGVQRKLLFIHREQLAA